MLLFHLLFLFNDMFQTGQDLISSQWPESESSATGLERRNDLGLVVADNTESDIVRVLLDDWNKDNNVNYSSQEE